MMAILYHNVNDPITAYTAPHQARYVNKRVKWLEKEGAIALPRRKWDEQIKDIIVLQGLKDKPVVDICAEHRTSIGDI